ncbi:MAG: amidohydrolase [Cyanobacteria bacterium NC_groundwater_1444_Ag_S-0.65um_54_12]|nr:amidohydrolase [Cyanobacteria bacterium NC_groundwater_1444_Ag_S-0.65um_54_12]
METIAPLEPAIRAIAPELIAIRRALHEYPEAGFEEWRTAKLIADKLTNMGLAVQTGMAKTGVVAVITGARPGRTLLVRADMDALPIREATGVPYSSKHEGMMHACGHDGHVAILLGLAQVLLAKRDDFAGNVKLVFQPAEEGPGGAEPLIQAGVLNNPGVDAAVGFHLWNSLPVGQVGVRAGPVMAATDQLDIVIRGKGGHGAKPHLAVDAVLVAAHVIIALQSIVSRMVDPLESAVITIGTVNGGFRHNVIAPEVQLSGTVRAYSKVIGQQLPWQIKRIVQGVCEALGASCEIHYSNTYPVTINDPSMAELVRHSANKILGPASVITAEPSMGGEDMSYYLAAVPGCYFFLGSANAERDLDRPHHSPEFDFDEVALPIGVQILQQIVLDYLKDGSVTGQT